MRLTTALGLPVVVLFVLAAELFGWGEALEYRRTLLLSEPWRLLTGHFVHLSLVHGMLNCIALLLLARLFAERLRDSELWMVLFGAPVAISLAFWIVLPDHVWYRGLSGTLHAVYFAGCVVWLATTTGHWRWVPVAALAGGAIKVLVEQASEAGFPWREWLGGPIATKAHLIGAVVGVLAGLWFARRRAERESV